MKQREKFSSRLGFLLISAGCAIGLGNVWRFPYVAGQYGGGAFVLLYLIFLVIFGLPILLAELSVGRASQKSAALSFNELEPKGSKWHIYRYFAMGGNYILMMFYTTVAGWMFAYVVKMATGSFVGKAPEQVGEMFSTWTTNTGGALTYMIIAVILGFGICSLGLQKGVEKITKIMMSSLFIIMMVLVFRAVSLDGAIEGLKFYLIPDFGKMQENGLAEAIFAAMGQAFFTLSVGAGSMAIFGSYIDKSRALTGEALTIAGLDTAVAIVAGLIIFPACSAFGVDVNQGPGLVFVTLPNIFNEMPGGVIWGTLFFIFMSFAALSTIVAVFENIMSYSMDLWGISRKKAAIINFFLLAILSVPCVLGFSVWSDFAPLGAGTNIMDLEDFIISNNILPLGSIVYIIFCVSKYGWGWDNFMHEVNQGKGLKFPVKIRGYVMYVLPILILLVFVQGYIAKFFA